MPDPDPMAPAATPPPAAAAPAVAPLMPGGKPLVGHLKFFTEGPIEMMRGALASGHPLVRLNLAGKAGFIVHDPVAIRRILVEAPEVYQKRTRGYAKLKLLLGEGLVTSEGAFWLRQRRIAQPAFKKPRLEIFVETMAAATEALVAQWAARGAETLDVAEAMNRLALRIAGETLFSRDVTAEAKHIGDAMLAVLERFGPLVSMPLPYPEYWPFPANLRMWRGIRTLHRVVDEMVAARRAHGGPQHDLLGLLMGATDPETGEAMTDRQLRDEALTMLLAGHETTANALTFALMLLAQHPELQDRAAQEAAETLGDAPIDFEAVQRLTFVRQVLRETLRLYPPVWLIARMPMVADTLCGLPVPAGAYVFVCPFTMHRHPEHWPDPERFDPDRFGPEAPVPDRHVYFPFSRGRRQCIGDRFAELEGVLILGALLRRFRFEWTEQTVGLVPSVTLRPKAGLRLRVRAR